MFISRVRKVNFNELSLQIQILCVKSSEDRYHSELEQRRLPTRKAKKEKDSIHKKLKMFLHIKY